MRWTRFILLLAVGVAAVDRAGRAAEPAAGTGGIRSGLVLHLSFDKSGETVKDRSGKGNDGKINSVKFTAKGRMGGAIDLDGKGGHVCVANSESIEITAKITVALWVNLNSLKPGGYGNEHGYIVNKGDDLWWNPAFCLGYTKSPQSQRARFHIGSVQARVLHGGKSVYSRTKLEPGKWVHLAGTYDGAHVRIYVNGRLEGSEPYAGAVRRDKAPVLLGGGKLGGVEWGKHFTVDARVDEVMIWNRPLGEAEVRGLVTGMPAGPPYLTRARDRDRILLEGGRTRLGTLECERLTLTTFFGKLDLPAGRVVGFVRSGEKPGHVRVVLTDGQVVAGVLSAKTLRLKPTDGAADEIPISKIVECGYRISKARPASVEPAAVTVLLGGGDLLALAGGADKMQLVTRGGKIDLPIGSLLRIEGRDPMGNTHRAFFRNGSILTGAPLPEAISARLALGPRVKVTRAEIRQLIVPARAAVPKDTMEMVLRNEDVLLGRLAGGAITVRTDQGEVRIAATNVLDLTAGAGPGGEVVVRTWQGETVSGRLTDKTVAVHLAPLGVTVKADASEIRSIDGRGRPPAELRKNVEALVARLGAASHRDRNAATEALIAMGGGVVKLLQEHRDSDDPEIRVRIRIALRELGVKVDQ